MVSKSISNAKTIEFFGWNYYSDGFMENIFDKQPTNYYYCSLNPIFQYAFTVEGVRSDPKSAYEAYKKAGWEQGYAAGESYGYTTGHSVGYHEGEEAGYGEGYATGEAKGYMEGFGAGQDDMAKTEASFKDMIFAIFDAPSVLIDGILNFEIFGINLAAFVKVLVTLVVTSVVVVFLLKLRG